MQLKASSPKDNHASTPEIEQEKVVKSAHNQLHTEMRSPAPDPTGDQPTKVWTEAGPVHTSSEGVASEAVAGAPKAPRSSGAGGGHNVLRHGRQEENRRSAAPSSSIS